MRKMAAVVVGMLTAAGLPAVSQSVRAADLEVPPIHQAARSCGPCGCLHVSYVRHRELKATYGIAFDPRSYDQTEPHYFWGAVRTYPRYWVDAELHQ
jgi:hypothetical protein